jgi:dihydroorotate dehydrogenase (NAD+) catalytic subunit
LADLSVDLGFIKLKNPLMPASGTFGYGEEFAKFMDLDALGAFILKGIYLHPRDGNPPPRIHETASGLLNSIGLAGPGSEELKSIVRRVAKSTQTPIVVNVCGEHNDEYVQVARAFDTMPQVAMLELNISCPNIKQGGKCPAQDAGHTYQLVKQVKGEIKKPLMVKLTPNVADILAVAHAAEAGGADCLSLVNTYLGMAVDLEQRRPVFKNVFAGYSGPAIKPLALRLVWLVAQAVKIPVVGIGGIVSGRDVLEYILVGAAAVQTGTINMVEPAAPLRIIEEMEELMEKLKINSLDDICGRLKA